MRYRIDISERGRERCGKMGFSEKIQTIWCPDFHSGHAPEDFLPSGSVFFHGGPVDYHRKHIADYCAQYRELPPLICTDLEEGAGELIRGATEFPSMFAAGEAGEEAAYNMGKYAAMEGRSLGYNWTLAPSVDWLANPDCPTTSLRSPGGSIDRVREIGLAYIRGVQDHGMIATAKHFPGDGLCIYDQHLTTPEMPLNKDQWDRSFGKIYRAVIDGGVQCIMPGHISFPAYDKQDERTGLFPPATCSKRILTGLLKEELGFDGLIVSDAIEMGGFTGFYPQVEAIARFIGAGGDIVLFLRPDQAVLDGLRKYMEQGLFSMDDLDNRVQRVLTMRERMAAAVIQEPIPVKSTQAIAASRDIQQASIRLLRDRDGFLPLKATAQKKALHVSIAVPHSRKRAVGEETAKELQKHFSEVDHLEDPGAQTIRNKIMSGAYDTVFCSVINDYNFGTNSIRLSGAVARNLMGGWMKLGVPVIFILHFHPLTHWEYKATMDCVVRTGGTVQGTLALLTEKLQDPEFTVNPDESEGDYNLFKVVQELGGGQAWSG